MNFIVKKNEKQFVDVLRILPRKTSLGRDIIKEIDGDEVIFYTPHPGRRKGTGSKKIVINRFVELDDLFFEGLGLWQGEGGKDKGLYFGNSCLEILLHFLKFIEQKFGISRKEFKVTLNVPELNWTEDEIKKKWSAMLRIPFEKFTNICVDPRINEEYVQVYLNGIVLSELMRSLHKKMGSMILSNKNFCIAYLRGIFAGEGTVILRPSGTIHHVDISTKNLELVNFITKYFKKLGIKRGKYFYKKGAKFPIHGRRNFERLLSYKISDLSTDKKDKFEFGLSKFQRYVMKGKEMKKLILQQLNSNPKTYNEIAKALNKGRSTIQSHYIPILEKKRLIKRIGKRKQAWLFQITEDGMKFLKVN